MVLWVELHPPKRDTEVLILSTSEEKIFENRIVDDRIRAKESHTEAAWALHPT